MPPFRSLISGWLLVAISSGLSCVFMHREPVSRETTAMDTFLTVTIYDLHVSSSEANRWIDSAIAEIRRIEARATDYSDSSEVGQTNRLAGIDSVDTSPDLLALLNRATFFSQASGGAFDVTVGPVVKAWNFLAERPSVPSPETIGNILPLVNYRNVSFGHGRTFLRKKGMSLDFGAIAKGYAVDQALEVLKRGNIHKCIIDLGGNLGVYWEGTHAFDSTSASIFIRHPRTDGAYFGSFRAGSAGISTSGDYQRFFVKDGIRYHHIINPTTGVPARGLISVTIVADNATDADAISTLVFVLGRDKGMKFIENTRGVEALIVYEEGNDLKFVATERMRNSFQLASQ